MPGSFLTEGDCLPVALRLFCGERVACGVEPSAVENRRRVTSPETCTPGKSPRESAPVVRSRRRGADGSGKPLAVESRRRVTSPETVNLGCLPVNSIRFPLTVPWFFLGAAWFLTIEHGFLGSGLEYQAVSSYPCAQSAPSCGIEHASNCYTADSLLVSYSERAQ